MKTFFTSLMAFVASAITVESQLDALDNSLAQTSAEAMGPNIPNALTGYSNNPYIAFSKVYGTYRSDTPLDMQFKRNWQRFDLDIDETAWWYRKKQEVKKIHYLANGNEDVQTLWWTDNEGGNHGRGLWRTEKNQTRDLGTKRVKKIRVKVKDQGDRLKLAFYDGSGNIMANTQSSYDGSGANHWLERDA